MSITKSDVQHVAKLARLRLDDEEQAMMVDQLNQILEFAEALNALDTSNVSPTTHVLSIRNVMRADEVRASLPIETVLQNAPDSDEGQFRVPAVLEDAKSGTEESR